MDTKLTENYIVAIVDSSGSMTKTDPKKLRIQALEMMTDSLSFNTKIGLVDFDSKARWVIEPTLLLINIISILCPL